MVLDTRYRKENSDTFPVRLRVTFNRVQKYYPTTHDLTEPEWTKARSPKPGHLKEKKLEIEAIEARANMIIEKMRVFSFDAFKKKFLNQDDQTSLVNAFKAYTGALTEAGRIGTAKSYEAAVNSLERFKKGLTFSDITKDFLEKYQKWMTREGSTPATIGIYLRGLRAVFNKAIDDEAIPADTYPFGKNRYKIPGTRKAKKALSMDDIGRIVNYKATGTTATMRDYWYFMYLCNGINCKDMILLKYKNRQGKFLVIQRAKTIHTETENEELRIPLHEPAIKIIEKYGRKSLDPDDYIFPVLEKGDDPETIHKKKGNIIRLINDHMAIIADDLKIKIKVTTGFARGGFATVLKNSGASLEFISESLGHSDLKVTQHYLGSFEDNTLHKRTQVLIPKKKKTKPGKVVNL